MSHDDLLERCIRQAVSESRQSEHLADRLVVWFRELADGNESVDELEQTRRRCEAIYDATIPNSDETEK